MGIVFRRSHFYRITDLHLSRSVVLEMQLTVSTSVIQLFVLRKKVKLQCAVLTGLFCFKFIKILKPTF